MSADVVLLGAGSLGSTEILLRSALHGLPLSDRLGERFTGNGDVLAFGYNTDQVINGPSDGGAVNVYVKPAEAGTAPTLWNPLALAGAR